MSTALVVYGTNATSATLSTAGLLANATGASGNHNNTTKIGTSTGYGEVPSQGTTVAWPALGSLAAVVPSGGGWLYDATDLENQQIAAGTWTAIIQTDQSVQTSASTADFYVRAWKIASDLVSYTLIGTMSLTAQSLTTTITTFTLTGSGLPAMGFAVGEKLYLDVPYNISVNNTGSSAATVKFNNSNSLTQGRANNMQVTTPGYDAISTANITVTNAGLNLLRNGLSGATNPLIKYVALGTNNTTPNIADTQLGAEIYRKAITTYTNAGTGEILITGYISPSDAVGATIAEIGFFGGSSATSAANSGTLIARGLYSLANKTSLESIQAVLDLSTIQA